MTPAIDHFRREMTRGRPVSAGGQRLSVGEFAILRFLLLNDQATVDDVARHLCCRSGEAAGRVGKLKDRGLLADSGRTRLVVTRAGMRAGWGYAEDLAAELLVQARQLGPTTETAKPAGGR